MAHGGRTSELALILLFVGILVAVPAVQIGVELGRGERVQMTDLLRAAPTEKNLRQFERTLEAKSLFQQGLRPLAQDLLYRVLGEVGAKALAGNDGWLFYRPDVRCLVEPDRPDADDADSPWVRPGRPTTAGQSAVEAIVRFRDQLKERGIELLVVPVPSKASVYPERLTARARPWADPPRSPGRDLIDELGRRGVHAVNLPDCLAGLKKQAPDRLLYLARDTHWTPEGAQAAAAAVAAGVRALAAGPMEPRRYVTRTVRVRRWGDILEMIQAPSARRELGPEIVQCEQVLDATGRLLVPSGAERPGSCRSPGKGYAPVLVLGDSFCRIYQTREPLWLGQLAADPAPAATSPSPLAAPPTATQPGVNPLLPGSAGFISHLARRLQTRVDYIVSDGGAASDVRKKLATNAEILAGKKVVVWEFAERDLRLGRREWQDVPLPPRLEE